MRIYPKAHLELSIQIQDLLAQHTRSEPHLLRRYHRAYNALRGVADAIHYGTQRNAHDLWARVRFERRSSQHAVLQLPARQCAKRRLE